MAKITISELRPAGVELFDSSESYLQELTDAELDANKGGKQDSWTLIPILTPIVIPQFPVPEVPLF